MTAVHDPDQPDTYPWRAAPGHLKTRRQLRAAGLRPNGQAPAALMVREPTGRKRRRLWAYLFDVTKAAPKRVATAAQLAAVDKAVREHQARAAERRGLSREELTQETDPGPQWHTPTDAAATPQEENSMSDTTTAQILTEQSDIPADVQAALAPAQGENPILPGTKATGHKQRLALLHAVVAINQARDRREGIEAAHIQAEEIGGTALDHLVEAVETELAATEASIDEVDISNPNQLARHYADVLTWRAASPRVAQRAEQITALFSERWGVLVNPDAETVGIDPHFDPVRTQTLTEAEAVQARRMAVLDVMAEAPLTEQTKAAVSEAVSAWSAEDIDPADPQAYLDNQTASLNQLCDALTAVKMPATDRARIDFTIDYLTGDTAEIDLLDTPVLVDPGEEARGRVAKLLGYFAQKQIPGEEMAQEISVMTTADQDAVRQAGRAIVAGENPNLQVFGGYVDREQLRDELHLYAVDAGDQRAEADYIADTDLTGYSPDQLGVSDELGERITRMAERRAQIQAAADGKGLTSMERHQITAVLRDIDTGRIRDEQQLPELMFVDERSKSEVDHLWSSRIASFAATAAKEALTQQIDSSGAVDPNSREARILADRVSSLGDTLYSVAAGAVDGVQAERKAFIDKRTNLGEALDRAGVGADTKTAIRALVDDRGRDAGQLGRVAAERRARWQTRTDQIIARRDDALAQRQAATTGRAPRQARSCATRPDRAAQTASPAPARPRHQQRSTEVQR
ncbi:RRQRL motif-containing zinc-binding protein [Nocardia cyriacigeorgica]|uniref:RRQRL motif-containing zinc-binding protein n=1 Tax=Nocardia cyriacigeorgica TaxID=135487 RepID=UPI0018962B47|nr:RRQRL motif-containing zinc-binding protein [Nocardia cyriacigeorgica]MBF6162993.1 hypothetical protein [Nocardia cyriacigeorgica]MBF6201972.1 hypothetical protein [Nocardia cyriacigeorgica]